MRADPAAVQYFLRQRLYLTIDRIWGTERMRRIGNICIILGLLLIAGALVLFLHNRNESARAGEEAERIKEALLAGIEEPEEKDPYEGVAWNSGSWDEAEPEAIPEMPVKEIDGYSYIGILDVPSRGISLPVMAEWDYTRLKMAPCRYSGSYFTGDLVVCGHNYAKHFSPIRSVDIGAEVTFTAVDGAVYHYIVSNRETVEPTEIDRMIDPGSDWDLTLFTCNLGGKTRCAVRCLLTEKAS